MPAVISLAHLDEARGLVRAANLEALRAADPKTLAEALARRDAAWRQADEAIAAWQKLPRDPDAERGCAVSGCFPSGEGRRTGCIAPSSHWKAERGAVSLGLAGAGARLASIDGAYLAATSSLDRLLDLE